MNGLVRRTYEAPGWGTGEVWLRDGVLVLHVLAGDAALHDDPGDGRTVVRSPAVHTPPWGDDRSPESTVARGVERKGDGFVADLCRRFAAHLTGERVEYHDVELDLDGRTDFERALTEALRGVPWGEVVTYGELATLAGRPRAARAAGTFCATCDTALVLPCHRVVAVDGIGGYGSSGVTLKRRLLRAEGVRL